MNTLLALAGSANCRPVAFRSLLCLAAMLSPWSVVAQEERPGSSEEIVVTGREADLLTEAEIKDVASDYVDTLTVVTDGQALPRYQQDVYCPGVVGMSEAVNSRIEQRMRTVAEAAGIEPAEPGCRTSALVIFVEDKESFLEAFRLSHPVYFRSLKDKNWVLRDEEGPAIAWHLAQLLDENGNPIARDKDGRAWVASYTHASRMRTMTTSVMAMSVAIVERDALVGLTITQIGDYAFMRGMTDASPATLENSAAHTILAVLSTKMGEVAPASLTEWDMAYVKARYESDWRAEGHKSGVAIRTAVQQVAEDIPPEPASDEAE